MCQSSFVRAVFVATFAFALACTACINVSEDQPKTYAVGDVGPSGGYVFYDKGSVSDGWRWMEAAPSDQSSSCAWGTLDSYVPNCQYAIGSGPGNTALIVAKYPGASYAANLCDTSTVGGKDDWFLPSVQELTTMCQALHHAGLGVFTEGAYYWASENYFTTNKAYTVRFTTSSASIYGMAFDSGNRVRPARRF